MKKTLLLTITLSLAATMANAAQVVESIVIRVGDRIITRTQYAKRLREAYQEAEPNTPASQIAAKREEIRSQLKDELVAELLVKDRADRLNLTVTPEEIKEAVERLKKQYGLSTDKEFEEALKKSGMNRADMEARMRETILSNKVFGHELRPREDLSDRELRERYDREKERYRLPERARLREIVVLRPESGSTEAAEKKATELAAKARTNVDFAQLATTSSEAQTKEKGGDLGEVARGELLPDLDKAVFNAQSGAVIGPIPTKSGWHILKVEQRLPSEVPAFESVKDKLRKDASDDAWQRDYKAYIARLRADANVQVNEANIPSGI